MTHLSTETQASLGFQHFLLAEMPGLFTRTAEEHANRRLQPRDGLAMEAIPRIIEEALRKAFTAWETRGASEGSVPGGWNSNSSPPDPSSSSRSMRSNHTPQPPPAIPTSEGYEYTPENMGVPSWVPNCGPPPIESEVAVDWDQDMTQHDDAAWRAVMDMVGRGGPFESDLEMGGYEYARY